MRTPLQSQVDDAPDHLIISEAGGACRAREPGPFRQIAVGVHVDDVGGAVGRQAHIQAGVVAQLHRRERRLGDLRDPGLHRRRQPLAGDRLGAAEFGRGLVPLAVEGDDARAAGRHLREVDLVERQDLNAAVGTSQQRDVDLAPFDVALDQRGLQVAGEHERHLTLERRAIVDDRVGRDPDRGVLARRLDDEREPERDLRDVGRGQHGRLGRRHAGAAQHILRLVLVHRQPERERRRARVGQPRALEQQRQQRLEIARAVDRLAKIEDHVGREVGDLRDGAVQIAADADRARVVSARR